MEIQVVPGWRVKSDPNQWVVERLRPPTEKRKRGGEVWESIGFYVTLRGALRGYEEARLKRIAGACSVEEAGLFMEEVRLHCRVVEEQIFSEEGES